MGTKRPRPPERFLLREVLPRDVEGIYDLSAHLDSVNIPHDRGVLRNMVKQARDSFTGRVDDPAHQQYQFVLVGAETGRIAGTSVVFAQHGHPEAPHVYFEVVPDERYSSTLERHFSHVTLRLGFSYRGPTEIGALVLDPELRAFGLGKMLSLVRFLFIAMYRDRFQDQVLAELMPPLLPDGRSELWEYIGQRFTGLTYQEADKLSHTNKEFIYALFPQTPLYASMLPTHVAELIGRVGEETRSAQRILESIGFRYIRHIDPFDGGPHFACPTDRITLVERALERALDPEPLEDPLEGALFDGIKPEGVGRYLVGLGKREGPTRFRAIAAAARVGERTVQVTREVRDLLGARSTRQLWLAPY